MVKLIILTFDGTVVDSKEVSVAIYNKLADKYGTQKVDDIRNIQRLPLLDRFKALHIPLYKLPLFIGDFTKLYKHSLKGIKMVKGMRELLLGLKKSGNQLAIVSSNSENNISDYFREAQLEVIDTIICCTSLLGKEKYIKKVLAIHKVQPSEAIFVGDELRDIKACKKLGIPIIWVDWGYDLKEMIIEEPPDYIAHSPQDILEVLN
ncbi:putative phosphatase [Desulfosporosinus orientis DSM 765]|uniref:Putative phosphatase n=1 Tax=Desulfosporosinus orientis (strain ATCC 19365 / DSM 765 / NCIMB 8382 / VKM B-1628 / Singapore I) TaxID=768706 RepID=G7WFF3_DESOD|nr:HAD hydrolase-like protein [Desulfosporosinus orientis]AET68396.1 putative phosphatase [Desulfosporosinus orientis DSM 765]